jgi:hypothetical protein
LSDPFARQAVIAAAGHGRHYHLKPFLANDLRYFYANPAWGLHGLRASAWLVRPTLSVGVPTRAIRHTFRPTDVRLHSYQGYTKASNEE